MTSPNSSEIIDKFKAAGLRNSDDEFLHQVAIGQLSSVSLFLANGMSPDIKNEAAEPAILIAAKNGHVDVVRELHGAGASLEPLVRFAASHTTASKLVDRLTSLSPLGTLISGLVIALVGWHFTNSYNGRQLELQQIQSRQNEIQTQRNTDLREMEVVEKMIPHLAEERGKTVALLTIRILARPELATQIAEAVGGPGSAEALVKMAKTATGDDRQANVAALANVAAGSEKAKSIAEPILSDARNEAVRVALDLVKERPAYLWGGKTPKGFDSSGFVAYALSQAGLLRNYTQYNSTALQQRFGIDRSSHKVLMPGDLIFYSQGACMLYIGGDEMVGILPDGVLRKRTSEDIGVQRLGVGHVAS